MKNPFADVHDFIRAGAQLPLASDLARLAEVVGDREDVLGLASVLVDVARRATRVKSERRSDGLVVAEVGPIAGGPMGCALVEVLSRTWPLEYLHAAGTRLRSTRLALSRPEGRRGRGAAWRAVRRAEGDVWVVVAFRLRRGGAP